MLVITLILFLSTLVLYWIIRVQIRASQKRELVDTYGLSPNKLRKMNYRQLKQLASDIEKLRKKNDAYGLENLIRPYRP